MSSIINHFKSLPLPALIISIAVIAFFVLPKLYSFFKGARKVARVIRAKSYAPNPQAPALHPQQQLALSVGAIGGEQQCFYSNSLTTGIPKAELRSSLADWWGITDSHSALETLEDLLRSGHRSLFDNVFRVQQPDAMAWRHAAAQQLGPEATEKVQNFLDAFPELNREGIYHMQYGPVTTAAWDIGRMQMLCRACFDAVYISDQQAWYYLDQGRQMAQATFPSWKEFGESFLIGRGMWGGNDMGLSGIISITKGLWSDADSPWRQMPLR